MGQAVLILKWNINLHIFPKLILNIDVVKKICLLDVSTEQHSIPIKKNPQQHLYLILVQYTLGVKVRNMKMDLNIYGTWRRVTFGKLMMKIYDFFIRLSHLVTLYNIV